MLPSASPSKWDPKKPKLQNRLDLFTRAQINHQQKLQERPNCPCYYRTYCAMVLKCLWCFYHSLHMTFRQAIATSLSKWIKECSSPKKKADLWGIQFFIFHRGPAARGSGQLVLLWWTPWLWNWRTGLDNQAMGTNSNRGKDWFPLETLFQLCHCLFSRASGLPLRYVYW